MGRKAGQIAFYYWMSKKTGARVGWLHPSRKAAVDWKNQKYWRYKEYPTLEAYLEVVEASRAIKEETLWLANKAGYDDLIIKKGVGIYEN